MLLLYIFYCGYFEKALLSFRAHVLQVNTATIVERARSCLRVVLWDEAVFFLLSNLLLINILFLFILLLHRPNDKGNESYVEQFTGKKIKGVLIILKQC